MISIIYSLKKRRDFLFPVNSKSDFWAIIALCIFWAPDLLSPVKGVLRIFMPDDVKDVFIFLFTLFPVILGARSLLKNISRSSICIFIILLLSYLFNYVIYQQNIFLLNENAYKVCVLTFTYVFIGSLIPKYNILNLLYVCSCFVVIWDYLYFANYVVSGTYRGTVEFIDENMSKSYSALPHIIYCLWFSFNSPSLKKILISLIGCFMSLSFGTRGPILCIVIYIIIYLFFFKTYKHPLLTKLAILLCGLFFISFLDIFMSFVFEHISNMNLSTRFFDFFYGKGITYDNGRNHVRFLALRCINSGGLFGYGYFGAWSKLGNIYPHDLYLDFITTFGIFGYFLLLMLFILIISCFIYKISISYKQLFMTIIPCSIIKLFLSGTFIYEPMFFLLIGMGIELLTHANRYRNKYIFL